MSEERKKTLYQELKEAHEAGDEWATEIEDYLTRTYLFRKEEIKQMMIRERIAARRWQDLKMWLFHSREDREKQLEDKLMKLIQE